MTKPKLNSELMHQVADAIEAFPELFNMGDWAQASECGTTCCVAGWAVKIARPKVYAQYVDYYVLGLAMAPPPARQCRPASG